MKKTSRMMMAEAIQEVFKSDLSDKQRASLKSIVEYLGDSLLIDALCSEVLSISAGQEKLYSTLITSIIGNIASELLFKMIEKRVDDKDVKYLMNLLTKQNDFIISRFTVPDSGVSHSRRMSLNRLFMSLNSKHINSKSGLKVLLGARNKKRMVNRALTIVKQARPALDCIVRKFVSYRAATMLITEVPSDKFKKKVVLQVNSPSEHLFSYMHSNPIELLSHPVIMNVDKDSIARRALERIISMPYTMDEQFNFAITSLLGTKTFTKLLAGKSTNVQSTNAKVIQVTHSVKEGLRFWDEAGKGIVYFSYIVDFRGRINQVGGISSVGNKVGKSMLRSGVKYPLGDHGHDQLLMGLASAMGYDKETFDVRLKWGKENEHKYAHIGNIICTNAEAGFMQLLKNGADDPFAAAAISVELHRLSMHNGAIRDYESNLFVGFDATSSAVQLVGLIMGNETLTEASNVRVGEDTEDKIHDAYMLMSNSMEQAVDKIKGTLEYPNADRMLDMFKGFDAKTKRAITKPLLMTRLYGSKFIRHIRTCEETAIDKGIFSMDDAEDIKSFAITIAALFNYAFNNEAGYNALRGYEDFVKKIAGAYSSKGLHSSWHVHSNESAELHKVISLYYKFVGNMYRVYADGVKHVSRTYNLNILGNCEESMEFEEVTTLNASKAKTAIAPNYIHSHDALVLYKTVLSMDCPLLLTHDCFAAPVGLAHDLHSAAIMSYADLFGDNNLRQLERLQEECFVNTGISVELPEEYNKNGIPATQIKKAIYAFS